MNLWQRIAKFFTEWDGEDMTKTMPLSVDDLRLVNSQRIMLTTLERERKEIKANAIDEFVIKLKRVRGYGLITNFDRPFGVTFNKLDEIAEELKGGAE